MSNDMRVDFLDKKITAIQTEISQVLNEMQVTVEGLAKMTSVALKLFDERIRVLENAGKEVNQDFDMPRDGIEL